MEKKGDDCGVQLPRCCILRCCVGVGGHLSDESLKEKGQGTHSNPTIEYYLTASTNLSICRLLTVRVLFLLRNKANVGKKTFNSQGISNWMLVPLVSVLFCPDLVDTGGRSRHCLSKYPVASHIVGCFCCDRKILRCASLPRHLRFCLQTGRCVWITSHSADFRLCGAVLVQSSGLFSQSRRFM